MRFSNLKIFKKVAILGIKGVAMSNIAIILKALEIEVYGFDTHDPQITDTALSQNNINVLCMESSLEANTDLLIYSASHGGLNSPLYKQALATQVKALHQAQILELILQNFKTSIAVCGCHGKTGTTSRLAAVFEYLNLPVSYCIGAPEFSILNNQGHKQKFFGGKLDLRSSIFVFEADEYAVSPPLDVTPKLEFYNPTHIINTNIDFDHPDVYKDLAHVTQTYNNFFKKAKWVYECKSTSINDNNSGIYAVCEELGISKTSISSGINSFTGVTRRLEFHGIQNDVLFFDDYGHHPAEIKATITHFKQTFKDKRLIVAFQSHTYSRTNSLKEDFVKELSQADLVLIDEVFKSARETADSPHKITAKDLQNLSSNMGFKNIFGFLNRSELVATLKNELKPGDILLTLGAGDIYKIINELMLIKQNFDITNYFTWRVKTVAAYFANANTKAELEQILQSDEFKNSKKKYIIGDGSNTLFSNQFYDGFVLKINLKGITIEQKNQNSTIFNVAAGENWHETIKMFVYKYNLCGMENLALIPGTFGASAVQNVAAYGQALEDVFVSLRAINIHTLEEQEFNKKQSCFAYRTSYFKSKEFKDLYIITSIKVELKDPSIHTFNTSYYSNNESLANLIDGNQVTAQSVFEAICKIRKIKLPDVNKVGTNGSLFVNPIVSGAKVKELLKKFPKMQFYPSEHMQYKDIKDLEDSKTYKIAAGNIFEVLGWPKKRINGVGTWAKSALVLCNYDSKNPKDILHFIKLMQDDFYLNTGINIIPEINIVQ